MSNIFNKKITLEPPLWLVLLVFAIGIILIIYFIYFTVGSQNNENAPKVNIIITANNPYLTRSYGREPNSKFWISWGQHLDIKRAKQRLVFDLKLPSKNRERIIGKLTAVLVEKTPSQLETEKSRAVMFFYSSGIRVMQSFLPVNQAPSTLLKDYKHSLFYEQISKEFNSVRINGVEGLAGLPGKFKNSNDVIEIKPGIVTWYKMPILYTVYGDGCIPLNKLIKVAQLFK